MSPTLIHFIYMSLINSTVWHSGEPSTAPNSRNCHIYSVWGRNEHQTPVPVLHSGNVKKAQIALDNLCHVEIAFQYILLETWPHTHTQSLHDCGCGRTDNQVYMQVFSCWFLHAWWLKCLVWAWRMYIPASKCAFVVVNLFVFISLLFFREKRPQRLIPRPPLKPRQNCWPPQPPYPLQPPNSPPQLNTPPSLRQLLQLRVLAGQELQALPRRKKPPQPTMTSSFGSRPNGDQSCRCLWCVGVARCEHTKHREAQCAHLHRWYRGLL